MCECMNCSRPLFEIFFFSFFFFSSQREYKKGEKIDMKVRLLFCCSDWTKNLALSLSSPSLSSRRGGCEENSGPLLSRPQLEFGRQVLWRGWVPLFSAQLAAGWAGRGGRGSDEKGVGSGPGDGSLRSGRIQSIRVASPPLFLVFNVPFVIVPSTMCAQLEMTCWVKNTLFNYLAIM